ncbi:tetratricopeptide repeat protein [Fimbriiglobus ruber]|uniref:GTP cyclohydrolase III (Methanopterin) n=1 Tax=Fimbriiglobus ruber TaxID=1908690 RepID=A0A225D9L4_9BACT|nr:tetratricopeptide repeat protein [Fimbriiglobus ruber]OWK37663.1 GTP cyclohydrolase III (methanopterin) [Fimbriiglobus ruber]
MSTGKISVSQLTLYNPARLKDAEVVAAFVARQAVFDRILADLIAEKPDSRAQHHLVVGQRGMGKSLLLARLAAELRTNADLSKRFVPLVFAEEQYAVDRLSKFWLNCLDSLADAAERVGDTATSNRIDAIVQASKSQPGGTATKDAVPARAALQALLKEAEESGKRLVLLVDNLQLVFERIAEIEQHALRELLMRPGSPILVGASPSPPPESQDYGAAFYDHFKIHYLKPLSADEMREMMLKLGEITGRADVRDKVMAHPERLKALRDLTGGNPRTVVTLFFLYAEDFSPSVFIDLENLLDRVTPLYKARIEELAEQQQVVVSAVADHWAPIPARTISESTGLPMTTISGQLDRLEKIGFVEKVELFEQSSTGFQIAERFFNVWFLMRSASRRQRREVEFLVRFIESFYEAKDRPRLAQHLMNERDYSPDRHLFARALACTLAPNDKEELARHAELDALRQKATEARRELEKVIDFSKLHPATLAFDDLREKLMALVPTDAHVTPEKFAEQILGDRQMFMRGERDKLATTVGKLSTEQVDTVLKSCRDARELDVRKYGEVSVEWFRQWLATGQLRSVKDIEDWNRTFLKTDKYRTLRMLVSFIQPLIGSRLSQDVRSHVQSLLAPQNNTHFLMWFNWGCILQENLGWYSEAEAAYRKAIAIDPRVAYAWNNLGFLLQDDLGRYVEAEDAYRKALELNPQLDKPLLGLGKLLQDHLGRYEEAEDAYRKALELNPLNGESWNGLGNLYCDHLHRYSDAIFSFTKTLDIDGGNEYARHNLVFLFRDFMDNMLVAKQIFEPLRNKHEQECKDTLYLHEAIFAAYDANWGLCRDSLTKGINIIGQRFPYTSDDDWFRTSAVLLHLNYGEELLAFLRERGDDARLRPWYEALSALHRGDRRYLQNIPVEVRTTAEYYFDQIEKRLNALPEKTRRRPMPKPAKKRRKS